MHYADLVPDGGTWDAYCKAQLQMTGKEADELIDRWLQHRRAVELQALIDD